ncbi:zf-CCHC domain-containing protein [Tanacetum coccineum]
MDSEGKYKEAHGNYKHTIKDKDGKDVVTPYEKLDENQKKMLSSKNVEAKIGISATFFRREEKKVIRQPYDDKKNFRKIKEDKKEERRCFKCGDPNHFLSDCFKNFSGDQKAFVVGSWSDSGDDSKKEEICLMAHSNKIGIRALGYRELGCIRRIARISVLPIEPNLAERARISAINLDDYQLDSPPPPLPSSPFTMAAYQRMIAEMDPTRERKL